MRVGIHFANYSLTGAPFSLPRLLGTTAQVADEGGVARFTVMDHYFQLEPLGGIFEPMLEGYTYLGYLAGLVNSMSLGLLVTGVTYRHPGLLAKIVTTLDVLSSGRAMLGIGAAWFEREHHGLGVPFPPVRERFERLEETLLICKQMWSSNDGPFRGTHYDLAETVCSPRPIASPHPPILIGGGGEQKTLRLVARYADACNLSASSHEDVAHKLDVLRRHCEAEGRDESTIEKTIISFDDPFEDEERFVRSMGEYAAMGIDLVELVPRGDPVEYTKRLTERVVQRLESLRVHRKLVRAE